MIYSSTITREKAFEIVNSYANQPKRTYVRVAERVWMQRHKIEGVDAVLVMHSKVYSKTWVKTTARVWIGEGSEATELTTKQAKKFLSA